MWKTVATAAAYLLLAGCDPVPFAIKNDTEKPSQVSFKFRNIGADCHAQSFLGGSDALAPGKSISFRCPSNEFKTLTIKSGTRTCRIDGAALSTLGSELVASTCFSQFSVPTTAS